MLLFYLRNGLASHIQHNLTSYTSNRNAVPIAGQFVTTARQISRQISLQYATYELYSFVQRSTILFRTVNSDTVQYSVIQYRYGTVA